MSFMRLNDIAEYIIPRHRDIEKKKDTREFNEITTKTRTKSEDKGWRWQMGVGYGEKVLRDRR